MFNIGLFGKSKRPNVVYLTSRTMPMSVYDEWNSRWSEVVYSLDSDGQANGTGTGNYSNQWLTPVAAGVGAGYEVRFTRLSGLGYGNVAIGSGTFGSWLSLSISRTIYVIGPITLYDFPAETIRVEIRAVGSATILATADITFQ